MLLNNFNTNSNELLAKRSGAVKSMQNSMEDLMLLLDSMTAGEVIENNVIGTTSSYTNLITKIQNEPLIFTIKDDGASGVSTIQTRVVSSDDVFMGDRYADIKTVFLDFKGTSYKILSTTNYKSGPGNSPTIGILETTFDEFPNDKLQSIVSSFGCQLSSLDLLSKFSKMAAENTLSKDVAIAYINKSESFISPTLYGMLMSALPLFGPENAIGAMNVILDNFFYNLKGYGESNGDLSFDKLNYEFDDSCILGFKEISSIVGQALSLVATIISPVVGVVTSVASTIVSAVSGLLDKANENVPQVDDLADHAIVDRPFDNGTLYSPAILTGSDPWMTDECKATLITSFFKAFAWRSNADTILIELFPLATKGFNVYREWSNGRSGIAPSEQMLRIQTLLNFSVVNEDLRTIRVTPLSPSYTNGNSWNIPDALGDDSYPVSSDSTEILWSRLANGLLLASIVVLSGLGDRPLYSFSKNSTRPAPDDYHRLISWWVFQYCNTYYSALFEGNLASNMVNGWLNDLIAAAGSINQRELLRPWLSDYNVSGTTYPSLYEQGLLSEDPFIISTPIIVSKGVGKLVPPSSRYSLAQKMAITGAITAAIIASTVIVGSVAKKSIKKSLARAEANAYNAQMAFNANPSDANYKAMRKANKKVNFKKWLAGASKSTPLPESDLSKPLEDGSGLNLQANDCGLTIQDIILLISGFKENNNE